MLFNELPENERFGHEIVCGGRTRAESVANGLLAIPDASDALVAVHDAARPLLSAENHQTRLAGLCRKCSRSGSSRGRNRFATHDHP